jgi:hypothetical protein
MIVHHLREEQKIKRSKNVSNTNDRWVIIGAFFSARESAQKVNSTGTERQSWQKVAYTLEYSQQSSKRSYHTHIQVPNQNRLMLSSIVRSITCSVTPSRSMDSQIPDVQLIFNKISTNQYLLSRQVTKGFPNII